MSASAPATPQEGATYVAHLEEVLAALEKTANYLYKSENSGLVESKPERLLLEVGAYATYFGALNLMSVSETKAVMHAVNETQDKLIREYPEIDDRDALWEQAKFLDLDSDETAPSPFTTTTPEVDRRRSVSAPDVDRRRSMSVPEVNRSRSMSLGMSTGMPANNDDAVADDEPEVLGVASREHFEDLDQVRQVHGQVALDEEIKAYFQRFAMEAVDDYGGSLLISIGQAIAIATACGSVTQVAVVAGGLQIADVARRHMFSKRTRRLRMNDVSTRELLAEAVNLGSRATNSGGVAPIVGRVALARRTLDQRYLPWMFGATGRGVSEWFSWFAVQTGSTPTLAEQAVNWNYLQGNWILKVVPDTMMEYSKISAFVSASGGLAVLGYTYAQREAIYASWRQREYKRLNNMGDAKAWKEEAEQSLAHVYHTDKQNRKAGIMTSIRNAFTTRKKERRRGVTEIQQIEEFINNMNDVDRRIRALLNAPPVEYDMTGRIGTSIVEEVFERMQAMRIC
jgi:hypothetical protein